MPQSASPRRHVLRWVAAAVVAVLLALAAALAVHVHTLLQPERFTSLLESELAAAGIKLELQAPADPVLFPHPGVRLQGFSLTNAGAELPVLRASGATIVVPWRTLWRGEAAIERVDVNAPRIDLGELKALLARLPRHAGPPSLPTITTGVHMTQGTLTRDGTPLLFDFSVAAGELSPGQTFQLDASARTAAGRRISATLATVPSAAHDGVIDLNPLRIDLAEQGGTALQLEGHGTWRGGEAFALQLKGILRHRALVVPAPATTAGAHAAASPAAPGSAGIGGPPPIVNDRIALQVVPAQPGGGAPMQVAVQLTGAEAQADLRLQPTGFGQWWSQLMAADPATPIGPIPLAGKASARTIDLGWLKASDVTIEVSPDESPAPAASASAVPATSALH